MDLKLLLIGCVAVLGAVSGTPIAHRPTPMLTEVDSQYLTPSEYPLKFAPRKRVPALNQVTGRNPQDDDPWRLPLDVVPVSYNVRLLPFLEVDNFTTDGYVEMTVRCVEATSAITFHSIEITLDVPSVQVVVDGTDEPVAVVGVTEDSFYQKVTVATAVPLTPGTIYKVSMKFVSILNTNLRGFYRSSYLENGVRKYLAVTQFEEADARRAFPCFDEPALKAVFQITLGHKDTMTSISNMPLQETIPMDGVDGYVWNIFQPSVKMSSYLVAFLVSEFDYLESDAALSNVQFRAWARPDVKDQLQYAANVGPKISEYFESNFGIDYPIAKQDQVAIPPLDYAAGAMENWGLITYSEFYMLYDPQSSTAVDKQGVVETIAHELAHQWTGDLVTMEWWNVIWLNEGFATYYQYFGTDAAEPTFREQELFLLNSLHYVFVVDSVASSRPINVPVSSPSDSSNMFDSISYDKGACIIRMMANFVGLETFNRAMTLYLNRRSYDTAGQDDLFQAVTDQAVTDGVNLPTTVKTIMDTWTFQMGYPIVNVTRNYVTGGATVTQERFLRLPTTDPTVYRWWVPLSYRSITSSSPTLAWLTDAQQSTTIANLGATSSQWVIFNVDQTGYYRVVYDSVNYGLIRDQLVANLNQISVNNRAQLLDDAFTLANLDMASYTDAFDMTLYLSTERSYTPWHAVLPELDFINSMFVNDENWKTYMSGLVAPYFNYVGFAEKADDEHLTILSRSDAMTWACRFGVTECAQGARDQFAQWMTSPADQEVYSRNQKSTAICASIKYGSDADWDYAFNRYLNPLVSSERTTVRNALGCTNQPTTQARMFDLMINRPDGMTILDGVAFFNALANNPTANSMAFDFLRDRWADLSQDYLIYLPTFFRTVTSSYNTQQQLDEMLAIIDEHQNVLGAAQAAVAAVQNNIKWMNSYGPTISDWLQQHV